MTQQANAQQAATQQTADTTAAAATNATQAPVAELAPTAESILAGLGKPAGEKPAAGAEGGEQAGEQATAEGGAQEAAPRDFREVAKNAQRSAVARRRQAEEAQRLRLERQQMERTLAWERQERARLEQELNDASSSPDAAMQFLQRRGVGAKTLVQHAADEQNPEAQMRTMRAELEKEKTARQQWEQQQRQQAFEAEQERHWQAVLVEASNKEKFPTLSRIAKSRPHALRLDIDSVGQQYHAIKHTYPSYEDVLAYLETEYSKAFREEPTSNGASQGGTKEATQASKVAQSRTLTGRPSEKTTLPKSMDEMDKDEQINFLLKQAQDKASRG